MTNMDGLSSAERDALKARADAWYDTYAASLRRIADDPRATLERLIDVVWREGILEHVSPLKDDVREARRALGRTLWRERNDPVLYWRIQYAMEHLRSTVGHTMTIGSHATAIVELCRAMGGQERERLVSLFPKLKHHPSWPWYAHACTLLGERARGELRARGMTPHDPALSKGSIGRFKDIPCMIDRIVDDGTFYMRAVDRRDTVRFMDLVESLRTDERSFCLCPSRLDARLFEKKDKR